DITYSFDKELQNFRHLRLNEAEEAEIPSITPAFPGAFVYENEIHDLYGFRFKGLSIDFKGTFIRTSVPYPFKKKQPEPTVTKVPKEAKPAKEEEK
ncbi:MAG TPA: NADH-quinone oxidoreductase subunit C, partial [Methanocorpusculum sp.]|nr:NADH-quinone oxidoreductase subunit C [Methanocorpusculum sp.]